MSSCLNLDPLMQYKTPLILWFRYCSRRSDSCPIGEILYLYALKPMALGPVKTIKAVDTVTNMTVLLTADLLRA